MAFKHGVSVIERKTAFSTQTNVDSAIPVVFGIAPTGPANIPVRVRSYAEAVSTFGFSEDFASFTLCEFIDSHFQLYGLKDAILVNVMDVTTAKKSTTDTIDITQNETITAVSYPLLESIKIKKASAELVKGTDYNAALDSAGKLVITIPQGSSVTLPAAGLSLTYDYPDVSKIKAADLIGSVNATSGRKTGFELLDDIMPMFAVLPGLVLAPKYSSDPTVEAAMTAKAQNINGCFKAFTLSDIDTTKYKTKQAAIDSKKAGNAGNYVCWPKVALNGRQYHLSTHMASVIALTDAENSGIPSNSPSNKAVKVDSCVLADGTPVMIGVNVANDLNAAGIGTMLSFVGTPRLWGNRTAAYPNETDPKDAFITSKRMLYWINNWVITDTWRDVDSTVTRRFIQMMASKHSFRFNGLTSLGALLGGRCEYNPDRNPDAQILDGKINFDISVGIATIAESIEFGLQVDTTYLKTLFG